MLSLCKQSEKSLSATSLRFTCKMRRISPILTRARCYQLQQQREFLPIIIAISTGAIVAHYVIRALDNLDRGTKTERASVDFQNSFGIDIGSSFSRIAMRHAEESIPFVIENREGKRSTPSTVKFPHGFDVFDKSYTGTDDDSFIVGTSANKSRIIDSDRTFIGSSLLPNVSAVGSSMQEIQKSFIYYLLAKDLGMCAISRSGDAMLLPAFVSVPNYFSSAHSSLLVSACRDGGFNCLASLPDGVSAVLGAIETGLYVPPSLRYDAVCVIDVGGGIVQLSLLLVKSIPNSIPIILSQRTLLNNGGIFFDQAIVAHLIGEFSKIHPGIDLSNDKTALQKLTDAAEAAKIDLSNSFNSKIHIPFITADQNGPKHFEYDLSKSQLNIILEKYFIDINDSFMEVVDASRNQFDNCAGSSDLRNSSSEPPKGDKLALNLAAVILVGGGARMSLLRSSLQNVTGDVPLLIAQQPEETVSIGASSFSKMIKY